VHGGGIDYAFVSGMKKSGTNWVARLIGTHPDVVVWGEHHLELLRRALESYAAPDWIPASVAEIAALSPRVARLILDAQRELRAETLGRDAEALLFVDHTPGWVELHLGPSARYVHVIRDIRDVIVSDAFHSMRHDEYPPEVAAELREHIAAWRDDPWYFAAHPDRLLHPAEVDRLAATWVDIVCSARELASRNPELVTLVRYEALHADVQGCRRGLLAFLGLDPSAASGPLDADVQPAFGGRGEDPYAFNRKGTVGDHRSYLSDEAERTVRRHAGELMRDLGYD
jgi:hypothetical protein